jgi:hypothetical protein
LWGNPLPRIITVALFLMSHYVSFGVFHYWIPKLPALVFGRKLPKWQRNVYHSLRHDHMSSPIPIIFSMAAVLSYRLLPISKKLGSVVVFLSSKALASLLIQVHGKTIGRIFPACFWKYLYLTGKRLRLGSFSRTDWFSRIIHSATCLSLFCTFLDVFREASGVLFLEVIDYVWHILCRIFERVFTGPVSPEKRQMYFRLEK